MAISDQNLTLLSLSSKNAALDRASTELKNNLNGDFQNDAPIQQKLAAIHAEQSAISSRLAAISSAQPFTPPNSQQVNSLGAAISALDADIKTSASVNTIIGDTTTLLNQYGAAASQSPPQ